MTVDYVEIADAPIWIITEGPRLALLGRPHPILGGRNIRKRPGGGHEEYTLLACPCGHRFKPGSARSKHIATHDPEDFGLTPYTEPSTDTGLTQRFLEQTDETAVQMQLEAYGGVTHVE